MTPLETAIRRLILLAIRAANGPMPEPTLKDAIRAAHPNVAFTDQQLTDYIKSAQQAGLVSGFNDPIYDIAWDLTLAGRSRAEQLS